MFLNKEKKLSDSVKFLKNKINIIKLNKEYFKNTDNVRRDLENFYKESKL